MHEKKAEKMLILRKVDMSPASGSWVEKKTKAKKWRATPWKIKSSCSSRPINSTQWPAKEARLALVSPWILLVQSVQHEWGLGGSRVCLSSLDIPLIKIGWQCRVVGGIDSLDSRGWWGFGGVLARGSNHGWWGGRFVPRTGRRGRIWPLSFMDLKGKGRQDEGHKVKGKGTTSAKWESNLLYESLYFI